MTTLREFSIAVQHAVLDPEAANSPPLARHDLYHGLSAALLTQLLQEENIDVSVENIPWNGVLLENLTALTERFMERDAKEVKNFDTESFSNTYSSSRQKIVDFIEEFYAEYEGVIQKSIEYYLEEIFDSATKNNPHFIMIEGRRPNNPIKYFDNPFFEDNRWKIKGLAQSAASLFLNHEHSLVPKGFLHLWISRVATMELALTDYLKLSHPWRKLEHAQKENMPLEGVLTSAARKVSELNQETLHRSPNITEIVSDDYIPIALSPTIITLATYDLKLDEFLDNMKYALVPAGVQNYAREIIKRPAAEVLLEAEQKQQIFSGALRNMLSKIF